MRARHLLISLFLVCSCGTSTKPADGGSGVDGGSGADGGSGVDGGTVSGEPAALAGITQAHNEARAVVGVAPLTWDPDLAAIALAWAESCIDNEIPVGLIDHNSGRSDTYPGYVGENIYGSTGTPDPVRAVTSWVNEEADYDLATNTCATGAVCGHYTQVVWADTLRVGCATARCPGLTYSGGIVCDYAPGGNIVGQRPYP